VETGHEPDGIGGSHHRRSTPPGIVVRPPVQVTRRTGPPPTIDRDEQPEVTVPNVVGMRADKAGTVMNQVALQYQASAPLEGAIVIGQDPRAGSVVRAGDTVRLSLSEQ
jgi:hypothetical protein